MNKRVVSLFVIVVVFFCQAVLAQEVSFDAVALQKTQDFVIPAITKVAITPSQTAVVIEWETDMPARSYIEYGETPAYGLRVDASTQSSAHRVEISKLSAFQTYHFRIRASREESANELFSRALTFTTLPGGEQSPSAPLFPTPSDFFAPRVTSFSHNENDGLVEVIVVTDEASLTRFEYGAYIKGAPFIFEERDAGALRETRTRFVFAGMTPGGLYLYRLTTQDRLGNRAILYGNVQIQSQDVRHSEPKARNPVSSGSLADTRDVGNKNAAPANSVLVTNPVQLVGIPKADMWKDEKSGRLYRIFRTTPPGSVLLTHPSQLAGLTVFQIWKDEKSGRLYRHAGIPNPKSLPRTAMRSNELSKNKEEVKSKESSENKEAQKNKEVRPASIPKQWIRITHPVQLKVLFSHEVWRDKKTGALYRMVGSDTGQDSEKAPTASNSKKQPEPYIPFYR